MNLMPNESVLLESEAKSLILTTHRVRYHVETFGNVAIRSIMLEELASCALVRSSNIIFLVLAGICFVLGLLVAAGGRRMEGALVIGVILGVVFVITYLASRRQALVLASAGTTIMVNTQGMKLEVAKQFIERTEAAKNERYLLLARGWSEAASSNPRRA
jgi:1,4-dihydroxy-2-naphthoate octaprenyltransferase